ncbi:MAG: winged helix-turn-helix domain-containing protein [Halobacteriota archaeon]
MSTPDGEPAVLPPAEAFTALADGTRMAILQTLAETTEPIGFSELRSRVGVEDSGRFNYHLDRLTGHFVRRVEGGYRLSSAGHRVIQAVLSGAITEDPSVPPTEVDIPCIYCGRPTVLEYRAGRVRQHCTGCAGTFGERIVDTDRASGDDDRGLPGGFVGEMGLPPAGIQGRSPRQLFETAVTRMSLELVSEANGICPRCSAPIEATLHVCDDHDPTEPLCPSCASRYRVNAGVSCSTCTHQHTVPAIFYGLSNPELLGVLAERGIDPLREWMAVDWSERLESRDPVTVGIEASIDGTVVSAIVDDGLEVRSVSTEPGE